MCSIASINREIGIKKDNVRSPHNYQKGYTNHPTSLTTNWHWQCQWVLGQPMDGWTTRILLLWWWECQLAQPLGEIFLSVSTMTDHKHLLWPCYSNPKKFTQEKYLNMFSEGRDHTSIIHNSHQTEIIQMITNSGIDKICYVHSAIINKNKFPHATAWRPDPKKYIPGIKL